MNHESRMMICAQPSRAGSRSICFYFEKHSKSIQSNLLHLSILDCVLPKLYPIAPLVDALDKCMSTSTFTRTGTVAYCTYEHRYYEPYNPKQYFIDLCHEKSLEVKQIPTEDQHPIYSVDDIEVWQITRK